MSFVRMMLVAMALGFGLSGCATSPLRQRNSPTLADAAYQRGDFADALSGYLAVPGGRRDPEIETRIGNCAVMSGHPYRAEQAYKRALQLTHDLPEVRYNLAVLYLKLAQAQLIAALPQSDGIPSLQRQIQRLLERTARIRSVRRLTQPTKSHLPSLQ